jgi:hypothetical protein
MISYFPSLFRRFLLFQFIFVFAYYKYQDISKSSYEFKDNFYELSKFFDFRNPQIDQFLINPIPVFQIFIAIQVFSAIRAVLGSKFFSFTSGLLLLVSSVIYYSPFRSRQGGLSGKFLLESFSFEFMLSIALVLAIFAQSFYSSKKNDEVTATKVQEEPVKTSSGRDSRPQSKGKKKHI